MKRKRFMQCNLLSINIFLEDFSNDNVVVHVRFELTIFVTTISRRFLPLKGIIMRTAKKPPLSLHAMSKCSLLEAQSCPVRTYGVTDIGKARPL